VLNEGSKIGQYLDRLRLPDTDVQVVPVEQTKDSLEMTGEGPRRNWWGAAGRSCCRPRARSLITARHRHHGGDGADDSAGVSGAGVPVILDG